MEKKPVTFDNVTVYKQWVNRRDEILEHFLRNNRLKNTDIFDKAFAEAIQIISNWFSHVQAQPYNKQNIKRIDDQIDVVFDTAARSVALNQVNLRRISYMLAHAGEAEAIAQVTRKPANVDLSHAKISSKAYASLDDGTEIMKRIDFALSGVRRKLIHSLELSVMLSNTIEETIGRCLLSLPKRVGLPENKTALKKIKKAKVAEANKPSFTKEFLDYGDDIEGTTITAGPRGGIDVSSFSWDNATWDEVIAQSEMDHAFADRSPASYFDSKNPLNQLPIREEISEEDKVYGWELEQQMTHDFVKSVRDGQIDAANVNGITEFIWIAILDGKTCENCCEWRSGLLTSEIEKVLAEDQDLADHCDVLVPPAHFNCRCGIAPVAGDVSDFKQPDQTKEFDDWLNGN